MNYENYFELIKVSNNYNGKGDFNGEDAALTLTEQKEYLKKYAKVSRERYEYFTSEKAVSQNEIEQALKNIRLETPNKFRNRRYLNDFKLSLVREYDYKRLMLYTTKASVINGVITLDDKDSSPLPCAKIFCDDIVSSEFIVNIDKSYFTPIRGRVDTMVTGRQIEFRQNQEELVKVQIYSDGSVYARLDKEKNYHHSNTLIGTVKFGVPFSFGFKYANGNMNLLLNGKEVFSFYSKNMPDTVFFGGGMYPIGKWSIKPEKLITVNGETDCFERCAFSEVIDVKEVNGLPYVFGTEKYKDCKGVFESSFFVENADKKIILHFDTLNPSGKIYVNNSLIVNSDNFIGGEIDITPFVKIGNNTVKAVVLPRGPEVLYPWHRHKDAYNGAFLGKIYIEERLNNYIDGVKLVTSDVTRGVEGRFDIKVIASDCFDCNVVAKIDGKVIENNIEKTENGINNFSVNFHLKKISVWNVEKPCLHDFQIEIYRKEELLDSYCFNSGFRTVCQKDGEIFINGKREILKGALIMQFLPPYEEIPCNHVCPSDRQIVEQALIAKKMGCNIIRMHQLGYGSNDNRFAKVFDALGLFVIWITYSIDSVATVIWKEKWEQKVYYQKQMLEVINSPSIIIWEGANELYLYRKDVDNIYREFVDGIKEIDKTRLICPVSHFYYGNDSYDHGCEYYQDDGKKDEFFRDCQAVPQWNDELVIRSAHTYNWLLGYGRGWKHLREQDWSAQPNLLNSKNHAYIISEYAVMGRHDDKVKEAEYFINNNSYELSDETSIGYDFGNDIASSQAYQALCAKYATKKMLCNDVDGMIWCCLTSGANDASYMKPPVDFYGYKKLAFYALKECFKNNVCFLDGTDVVFGKKSKIRPIVVCNADYEIHTVRIKIFKENYELAGFYMYKDILFSSHIIKLSEFDFESEEGYYIIETEID